MVFLSPSKQNKGNISTGNDHFLPNPFQYNSWIIITSDAVQSGYLQGCQINNKNLFKLEFVVADKSKAIPVTGRGGP
jgi:hypothetical protein